MEIRTLTDSVLRELEARGYAGWSLLLRKRALSAIAKWFVLEADGVYSHESHKRYEDYLLNRINAGEIGKAWYGIQMRLLAQMQAYCNSGTIDLGYGRCGHKEYVPSSEATDIIAAALSLTQLRDDFKRKLDSVMRRFFCFAEESGISPQKITHQTMVTFIHKSHDDGITHMDYVVRSLRILAEYFVAIGKMPSVPAFGFIVSKQIKGKIIPAFTDDEVLAIMGAIDRTTPVGKRNFAIILLALGTGLRAGDIARLKRADIDYAKKTITLVQSKTKKPLVVTISGQICNAIADYLLGGRPPIDSDNVFARARPPFSAINPPALSSMMSRVCERAGIEKKPYRNFHSLRRTFGIWLASGGVPVHTISQMFGHAELNSSKRYLPFQDNEMSQCVMGFEDITIQGGVYAELS